MRFIINEKANKNKLKCSFSLYFSLVDLIQVDISSRLLDLIL